VAERRAFLVILMAPVLCETPIMARRRTARLQETPVPGEAPDNLYDYAHLPARRVGRPIADDVTNWTVSDDWPEDVPVTEAEIEVFEAWFGDMFDEMFSTRH
jgi:hypothetical protein